MGNSPRSRRFLNFRLDHLKLLGITAVIVGDIKTHQLNLVGNAQHAEALEHSRQDPGRMKPRTKNMMIAPIN